MKIFITGATGYIGHQLALKLANQGNVVHIIVRDQSSPNIPVHNNIIVFPGDITYLSSIKKAMAGCEQVYHTAAIVKLFSKDPSLFYKVNVDGTRNLLGAAVDAGVKKFVYTSTCGVLGASVKMPKSEKDPRTESFDNEYEFTKFLAENLVKDYVHKGLFTVIVSPSKVYGPGIETHPVSVNWAINNFIKGKLTIIPKPSNILSNYCFIDDIVNGHILAMQHGLGGDKYILGGENLSYEDFFHQLRLLSGSKARIIPAPRFIVHIWALAQWCKYLITKEEPFVTIKGIHHIFINKIYSNEKAKQKLGYRPTPLQEALKQTIQFLKQKNYA
ncbi:MAG TPA: NAD-dependent epimerase/dehydratase family protein [Ferruginibacter sp.]|nr:NAD-dependent epimerase/dehydratase family protein [Ferruginibacter sp.]